MLYLQVEDIVANAMIELEKINGTTNVSISLAKIYGNEVANHLKKQGYLAKLKIDSDLIRNFEQAYSDYFSVDLTERDRWYLLRENKNIDEVRDKFRNTLPLEVSSAFSSLPAVDSLARSINKDNYFSYQNAKRSNLIRKRTFKR